MFWRGKPIFIRHRTKKEIEEAREGRRREPARSASRTQARVKQGHDQWLVVIGICTHLGCVPLGHAGRLRRLVLPLPRLALRHLRPHPQGSGAANLPVPPYAFVSDTKIQIG